MKVPSKVVFKFKTPGMTQTKTQIPLGVGPQAVQPNAPEMSPPPPQMAPPPPQQTVPPVQPVQPPAPPAQAVTAPQQGVRQGRLIQAGTTAVPPAAPAVATPPPPQEPAPQMPPMPPPATQQGVVRQGRLIQSGTGASPVAPAPQPSVPMPSQMTLRPGSIKNPEAAPSNETHSKPGSETSAYVKPAMDKTSARLFDMPGDLQKILENEAENYKDQVQSFVDLCETFSGPGWQFADVIDYIHMLVRSVNLDVLSLVLTDPSVKGKFSQVISRGYKSAPAPQIIAEWESSVNADATVNWDRLMEIAADKNTKICRWILGEGLHSVGYVPIHDNTKIYGFMLVGVYENKMQSALASSLLELCGNRIGLILETRRGGGTISAKAIDTVKTIKDHLSLIASSLEVMKMSAKIGSDDVVATSEKCLKTLAESRKLVDRFAEELSPSPASDKNA